MYKRLPIPNFTDYEIDTESNIYTMKFGRNKILKKMRDTRGYNYVNLYKNGKINHLKVARLMCMTFVDDVKPFVNHKDGNKSNDVLSNLEWCTPSQNTKHAYDTKLMSRVGSKHNRTKLTENDIIKIRNQFDNNSHSIRELMKIYKMSRQGISHIVKRTRWTHV